MRAASAEGPDKLGEALNELYDQTLDALLNDLNTPVALAKALEGAKLILKEGESMSKASAESGLLFLDKINAILGIVRSDYGLATPVQEEIDIDEERGARGGGDFGRGGVLRLGGRRGLVGGFLLEDAPELFQQRLDALPRRAAGPWNSRPPPTTCSP